MGVKLYSDSRKVAEIKRKVSKQIDGRIKHNFRPDQLKWIALNGNADQSIEATDRLIVLMDVMDAKDDDTQKRIEDRAFEATKALHHVYALGHVDSKKDMERFSRALEGK